MTDTTATLTADPPPPPPVARERPSRLNQALAWVGIVAGVVFIVAVVFFSGFVIGKHSGGHGQWGHHMRGVHVFHRGGPPPMMGPGMWMGPGGPGGPTAPGGPMGPGPQGPGAPPSPTTVPTPRP
jgi:hypothetical protein